MEYPGLDVRGLTDDQIQKKIGELTMRLSKSHIRSDIAGQMHAILNILRAELQERAFHKSTEQDPQWKAGVVLDTDDVEKEKDDLDKLIDIN